MRAVFTDRLDNVTYRIWGPGVQQHVPSPARLRRSGVRPAAVGAYLDTIRVAATRACYAETLGRLIEVVGAGRPACELTPEDYAAVMLRWDGAAGATWNRHLSALGSFTAWAQRQEILATNGRAAPGAPGTGPPRGAPHPRRPAPDAAHR